MSYREAAQRFECISFVLGATALVLTLHDCGSKVPDFRAISLDSRQIFIFKALNQLQDHMPDWVISSLSEAPVPQTTPQGFSRRTGSPARHKYPSDFKTDFVRSRTLLNAASDRGDSLYISNY